MIIRFADDDLEKPAKRQKRFGKFEKKIEKIIIQMQAADNLDVYQHDFPGAGCHELIGDKKGFYTVNLTKNWRLLFRPEEPYYKDDGGIDKKRTVSIIIDGIIDTH